MDHMVCKQVQLVARKGNKKHGKEELEREENETFGDSSCYFSCQCHICGLNLRRRRSTGNLKNSKVEMNKGLQLQKLLLCTSYWAKIPMMMMMLHPEIEEKGFKMDLFRGERTKYVFLLKVVRFKALGLFETVTVTGHQSRGDMGISADLIAAHAVSSLHISENNAGNA